MVQVGAYQQVNNYYNNPKVDQRTKYQPEKTQAGYVDKKKESGLSRQAQDVLKQLRSKYKDMDFMVMNKGDNAKEMLSKGAKEFSVLFSSDELEKMASDEKYMEEKIKGMEGAVRMSKEINQKFGYEQALGAAGTKDTEITRIGIEFRDDGSTSLFAELEKSSAKQKERIEDARDAKRTENQKNRNDIYSKNDRTVKRATVQANSMEELLEKIKKVNWDDIRAEKVSGVGGKYDFSI
ncbi:MAG: hypothetical protein HFH49_03365 [Lachnospiraceae bacterium]|nr:hypothetical protein [Lachnospiraceae bacterium]